MSEKRERRCETCAAWDGSHGVEESGYCRSRAPTGCDQPVTFAVTDRSDFCLVDYTPLDMMNGAPDVEELLTRILQSESSAARLLMRLEALESRAENSDGHAVKCRERLSLLEERLTVVENRWTIRNEVAVPQNACCGNCDHWVHFKCLTTHKNIDELSFGGCGVNMSLQCKAFASVRESVDPKVLTIAVTQWNNSCDSHEWSSPPSDHGGKEKTHET